MGDIIVFILLSLSLLYLGWRLTSYLRRPGPEGKCGSSVSCSCCSNCPSLNEAKGNMSCGVRPSQDAPDPPRDRSKKNTSFTREIL